MKTPRAHQKRAVERLWDKMTNDYKSKPLCVVPVGGGKSFIMAMLIEKCKQYAPKAKVICLSHVAELAQQLDEEIEELLPNLSKGFYSDKLNERAIDKDVILATIQSIYKRANLFFGGFDICLIDECHTISSKDKSMYRKFLEDLLLKNPQMRIIGLTGTAFRSMKYTLIEEPDALFTDIAYQVPMMELIENGTLCEIVTPEAGVKTFLSAEGVDVRGGDYVESQLQKAVDKHELTSSCVEEILLHGKNRKKGIVFTSGVEHAKHVYEEFISQGETSVAIVTGKTPTEERKAIVKRYKYGDLKYLINVACFTTGFNNPAIDLMAIMRPMRSPVLYTQVLGRGMRSCEGKINCLLLDFGGVVEELGPIDTLDARIGQKTKGASRDAPLKICPSCQSVNFAGVRICHECGFEFPEAIKSSKLDRDASTAAVLSTQKKHKVKTFKVCATKYFKYQKDEFSKPVLKVVYWIEGGKTINEFVHFEATNGLRSIACHWFKGRVPNETIPLWTSDALKYIYPEVTRIEAVKNKEYYNVTKVYFD